MYEQTDNVVNEIQTYFGSIIPTFYINNYVILIVQILIYKDNE